MLVKVFAAAVQGIDATLITIEVNSTRGCMFYLVGLPDSAVKESHQRIISALHVNGYKMPTSNIVINMAPADIRKEGSAYDLPLAIGMLAASEAICPDKLDRYLLTRRQPSAHQGRPAHRHQSARTRFRRHDPTPAECSRSSRCE